MKKTLSNIALFLFCFIVPYLFSTLSYIISNYVDNSSINLIFSLIFDLLYIIILYLIFKDDIKKEWKNFKENWKKYLEDNIQYWIMGLIMMTLLNMLVTSLIAKDMSENETIIRDLLGQLPVYMFFLTVVVAPFTEELTYRKALKRIFKNDWVYIIVAGVAFGFAHVISTFESVSEFLYVFPYGVLGSVFAYMYIKTKNIFVPMSFHLIHNFMAIVVTIITMML